MIDEKLNKNWTTEGIQDAVTEIIETQSTIVDDLIKNIENNNDLESFVKRLLIENDKISYVHSDKIISYGTMFGIFKSDKNKLVQIHNKIFEIVLYNHIIAKLDRENSKVTGNVFQPNFLDKNGDLEMEKVLLKFQQFVKETYSNKDEVFYERQGRLLLIAFVKPIINGTGFYYVESQHSYEKRSDMIIAFNKKEYILELKIWRGREYHTEGLEQLASYLNSKGHNPGYLVVFNFNKNKEFTNEWNDVDGKRFSR